MSLKNSISSLLSKLRRPVIWIPIILALVLIAVLVIERVVHDTRRNQILNRQTLLLAHYQSAPVSIDTVHDTIYLPGKVIITPVPLEVPVVDSVIVVIHDTLPVCEKIHRYDSLFLNGPIRFRWQALGSLHQIAFSDFTWPRDIVTITRHIDTCIIKPLPQQPAFRFGPYVGLSINSLTRFPAIESGAQLIFKDQITIAAGLLYLDGICGNLRLGWLFK